MITKWEEDRAELKDHILGLLKYESIKDIRDLCDILNKQFHECYDCCDELESVDGHIKTTKYLDEDPYNKLIGITQKGKVFIERTSHSSELESEKDAKKRIKRKKKSDKRVKYGYMSIILIIGLLTVYLTNKSIDFSNEINNIKIRLDSLERTPSKVIYLKDTVELDSLSK